MAARTRRTPLSREAVLAAALRLADAEGLDAVSMRRLAGELGVEAMSLYHHLPGKAGLLDGLVEAVAGEIGDAVTAATERLEAGGDGDWRLELRGRCLAAREVMLRHPWAPALITSRPTIPPAVFGIYEGALATMIRGGLSYHLAHRALHALGSMVLGFAQEVFSPASGGGATDTDAVEADLARMAEVLPHLTAMAEAEMHAADDPVLGWCDSQTEFEFTLDLLLDGLERLRQ